jgi:membrane-bound serine protease (ClpP class)
MKTGRAILGLFFCPALSLFSNQVTLIDINGPIGPATAEFVSRAIARTATQNAECLIVQIDTPGGLLDSTKQIVQKFYAASKPVVVYVAPSGASATSAGCFITLASDVAAMAPNTSIGAAHPVLSGGGGGSEKQDDVMKEKLENFASSYIEAIAQKRNRNVEWAKDAVKKSASITAEKARELKVVEIIATDLPDLLRQLDGRTVNDRALRTASAEIVKLPMSSREKLFQVLWRPEVMFILMLIAIYGIIGELSNPGVILPGVAGGIALILALYMGSILPVNIAGVALIVLAIALFIVDVFAPTHGVLTAGGIISFVLGSFMLFDTGEALRLSWKFIIPATVLTSAFFLFVFSAGLRAQFLPVKAGAQTMIGKTVNALTRIDADSGRVFIEGEYWNALSDVPIEPGRPVEIVGIRGLTLKVKPKPQET